MKISTRAIVAALFVALSPSFAMAQSTSGSTTSSKAVQVAYGNDNLHDRRVVALKKDASRLLKRVPKTLYDETALGCIAVAVYHEARGESILGQKAVASVVIQRAVTPNRWGENPCAVVKPVQFSFMTSTYRFPSITDADAWKLAVRVALTVMYEGPIREIRGADHYHANYVHPSWRHAMVKTAQIGRHIFYSDPESEPVYRVSR
jgi:spore germination cell wall hydrolase CwlJ-like protein